jgi:hypothetical protein
VSMVKWGAILWLKIYLLKLKRRDGKYLLLREYHCAIDQYNEDLTELVTQF